FVPPSPGQASPIAISEGGDLCRFEGGDWKPYLRIEATENRLERPFRDSPNSLWAIVRSQAMHWSLQNGKVLDQLPPVPDAYLERIFVTRSGKPLGMTREGVFEWTADKWLPYSEYTPVLDSLVHSFLEPVTGEYWLGYNNGIERWKDGTVQVFGEEDGVDEGDTVASIYQTRGGDLWFATRGSGVYVYDGSKFDRIDLEDGLLRDSIQEIHEGSDGTMWVSYRYRGVAMWKAGQWVSFSERHGLPNSPVTSFAEDANGDIWVSTASAGLFRYRSDTKPPDTFIGVTPTEIGYRGTGLFAFGAWDAWNHTPEANLRYSWRVIRQDSPQSEAIAWTHPDQTDLAAVPPLPHGAYRFEVRAYDEDGNLDPSPAAADFEVLPPIWLKPGFYIPVGSLLFLAGAFAIGRHQSMRRLKHSQARLELSNKSLRDEIRTRIEAEKALRKAEERSRILIQTAPRGIVILDSSTGKFIEVNRAATEIYGLSSEELLQKGPVELSPPFQPDGAPSKVAAESYISRALQGEKLTFEWVHLDSQGSEKVCEIDLVRLSEMGTHLVRASLTDITQRKKNQQELEDYRLRLEDLIKERTAELEAAQDRLLKKQKLETLGSLVATVSHELRNPLGSIAGSVFTLKERLKEEPVDVDRPLLRIERNIVRCTRIIEDLLDFTRTKNPTLISTRIDPWLKEMLQDYDFPEEIEVDIQLETEAEAMIDRNRVFRCVVNLINNACDAMLDPRRGDETTKGLKIASRIEADRYLFQVTDTGPGISREELEKVLEPLYSTKSFGVGLGLPIVSQIMEQHEGGLELKSEVGKGTTATLWLPLVRTAKR
ncbi:MAG: PAS domain S-box protein, partial [Candidatus Omnitrophica bacterium]|nr:PAS domain S-box protein [Candidatus Omnitrophota bacterium]